MKIVFYKINCLTNLHVGSGEVNYNIIDNEVEKDAVNGLPVIHASGIKGALRDAFSKVEKYKGQIDEIFGKAGEGDESGSGSHKFLDATLVCRPMRVQGSNVFASLPVVTLASVNGLLQKLNGFGVNNFGIDKIDNIDFGKNEFLSTCKNISIECEDTGVITDNTKSQLDKLASIIGKDYAVVRSFDDYDLPVTARNCVDEKRRNLWYEEVVPHGSVLYFGVIYPDNAPELEFPSVVQFGGNASIGCGYTKITRL